VHPVVAQAARQRIITLVAIELIVAVVAEYGVVAETPRERVIATLAVQDIIDAELPTIASPPWLPWTFSKLLMISVLPPTTEVIPVARLMVTTPPH
jgi:hypothetical protein